MMNYINKYKFKYCFNYEYMNIILNNKMKIKKYFCSYNNAGNTKKIFTSNKKIENNTNKSDISVQMKEYFKEVVQLNYISYS